MRPIVRGEIYFADLSPVTGSEQGGARPILIIQNNLANTHSPTIIAAVFTSKTTKPPLPTHVIVYPSQSGLRKTSVLLAEQLRTLDKCRLQRRIGKLDDSLMEKIDLAICISLGLSQ